MEKQLQVEIDELFNRWQRRHTDVDPAFHVDIETQSLLRTMRPEVQKIYRDLDGCRTTADFKRKQDSLYNLARPKGQITTEDEEKLWARNVNVLIDLMLTSASYIDVERPQEVNVISSVIERFAQWVSSAFIHNKLLSLLIPPGLHINPNGQILAIASLVRVTETEAALELLVEIIKNASNGYAPQVQEQALVGLCIFGQRAPELCTDAVYDVVCNFLLTRAATNPQQTSHFIQQQLTHTLPHLGPGMLQKLAENLWTIQHNNKQMLTNQRKILSQLIGLFGDQSLDVMLPLFLKFRDNGAVAAPLIRSLTALAQKHPELWRRPVRLAESGEEVTLVDSMLSAIENNEPTADVAASFLGRASRNHAQVNDMLLKVVSEDAGPVRVRANAMLTLVKSCNYYNKKVADQCKRWLDSGNATLRTTALIILSARDQNLDTQRDFAKLLLEEKEDALRLCRVTSKWVYPILDLMLHDAAQYQGAIKVFSTRLDDLGLDLLADAYNEKSYDHAVRLAILQAFEALPRQLLERYRSVILRAYERSAEERQIAQRLDMAIGIVPR